MKYELTRIHLGKEHAEVGVQFDVEDGAGDKVRQRAFLAVDGATLAPAWAAVEAVLAEKIAALPLDLHPGNVTSALMKQRDAEHAAMLAHEQRAKSEAERDAARAERDEHAAAVERHKAELARLDEELQRKRAEAADKSPTLSSSSPPLPSPA